MRRVFSLLKRIFVKEEPCYKSYHLRENFFRELEAIKRKDRILKHSVEELLNILLHQKDNFSEEEKIGMLICIFEVSKEMGGVELQRDLINLISQNRNGEFAKVALISLHHSKYVIPENRKFLLEKIKETTNNR